MNWKYKRGTVVALVAALALGLAACGSGGDDDDTAMMCPEGQVGTYPDCSDPPPPPTAYETASAAIAAATTAEAAQAAYDAVKDDVTASQGDMLQMKVNERIAAIQMAARVTEQKMALMTAAGMIDTSDLSTQALVDAANEAIRGLRQALEDAADVSDADKAMYMTQLGNAVDAVDEAQGGIDTATRRSNQMTALSDASGDLQAALAALSGATPTQAQLDAANNALTALNNAITGGADLTDTEKAPYQREAANAAAPIRMAQNAFDDAEDEDEKARNAAMAVTAAKLYAGIGAPMGTAGTAAATDLIAGYNTAETAIEVSIGDGTNTPAPVTLSEDKKTMVAAHHGWAGKRYADPAGGDSYEAVVYSNVEAPKMGRKFGTDSAPTATSAYLYQLNADEELTGANAGGFGSTGVTDFVPARVAFRDVTRTSGTETFKLPDPNTNNAQDISVPGSYHGVSGTYICDTGTGRDQTCMATVAATGFTLAGSGTWTFKPGNADHKVMDVADTAYASYGWWILKAANNGPFTASAFHDFKDTPGAVDIAELVGGTAMYVGGAAGKYALSSSTGGTNDAGHFTARATLEADFEDDMITGTIDNFMGADGMARNWSVELNETDLSTGGVIDGLGGDANDEQVGTVWTIDGEAGDTKGQWSGNLREEGMDGVPKVATGTFYSEYGRAGKMVGAFGANKQ